MAHSAATCFPSPDRQNSERSLLVLTGGVVVRLASRPGDIDVTTRQAAARHASPLRNPDLLADMRQARATRFADRYEWLALRRRRAQIAARHALGGC